MGKYTGRIIRSKDLVQEFREKELSRRRFVRSAATVGAGLPLPSAVPGCVTSTPSDDDDAPDPPTNYLVGMATGDQYTATLRAALNETVGRNQLEFIQPGERWGRSDFDQRQIRGRGRRGRDQLGPLRRGERIIRRYLGQRR